MSAHASNVCRRVAWLTALICAGLAVSPASASAVRCGPFTRVAAAHGDNVLTGPITGFGWHGNYDIAILSYLQRCGNLTRARHQVYIDSRRVPRGQTFGFNIWTRRSDGRWRIVPHRGLSFEVSGSQGVQETVAYQLRTTHPPARLTHVRIRSWVFGTWKPRIHTMTPAYRRFLGPEAGPAG